MVISRQLDSISIRWKLLQGAIPAPSFFGPSYRGMDVILLCEERQDVRGQVDTRLLRNTTPSWVGASYVLR